MITYEQTKAELGQLVDERPDFIYRKHDTGNGIRTHCLYVHPTPEGLQPGCIVGHWLQRFHAVPLERLHKIEKDCRWLIGASEVVDPDHLDLDVDLAASNLLDKVQGHQDGGKTWAEALHLGVVDVDAMIEDGELGDGDSRSCCEGNA